MTATGAAPAVSSAFCFYFHFLLFYKKNPNPTQQTKTKNKKPRRPRPPPAPRRIKSQLNAQGDTRRSPRLGERQRLLFKKILQFVCFVLLFPRVNVPRPAAGPQHPPGPALPVPAARAGGGGCPAPCSPPCTGEGAWGCGPQARAGPWGTSRLLRIVQRSGSTGPPAPPAAPGPRGSSPPSPPPRPSPGQGPAFSPRHT